MSRELIEIEWSGNTGEPAYLRFTKLPIAKTEAYAAGEVNLDLDEFNEVVGIEMLSFDAEDWMAVAQIGKRAGLRFDLFLGDGSVAKVRLGVVLDSSVSKASRVRDPYDAIQMSSTGLRGSRRRRGKVVRGS